MRKRNRPARANRVLLLVGDTEFTRDRVGSWHTLGALSKQLDQWFAEFDRVVIAAHIRPDGPPSDHRMLTQQNITVVPLHKAGGSGPAAKARVAIATVGWAATLVRLMKGADAVHLRAPCNVTLVAIPLARILCPNRYAIYADNWEPLGVEPYSYRIQRWMLRHFGGVVHVYAPDDQVLAPHLRPNVSPSFSNAELDRLEPAVARRKARLTADPVQERAIRLACVASFSERKNQEAVVRAAGILRARGIPVHVRLAGVGPTQARVSAVVQELGLDDEVEFLGQIGRAEVEELLEWADINLLVSLAEGYGKVLLEGMSVGCPAVCGPGLMQRSIVGGGLRGRAATPPTPTNVADAVEAIRDLPTGALSDMVDQCRAYVRRFTIEAFGDEVRAIMREFRSPGTETVTVPLESAIPQRRSTVPSEGGQ